MALVIQFGSRLRELYSLAIQSRNGHEPVERIPSVGLVLMQARSDMCVIKGCNHDEQNDIRPEDEINTSDNQAGD